MKGVLIANKTPLLDNAAGTGGRVREADTAGAPRRRAAPTRPVSLENSLLQPERGDREPAASSQR